MNARQTQGVVLMVTALGMLVLPGILINNFQAEGLLNPPGSFKVCPAGETLTPDGQFCSNPQTNTIVLASSVGCQANPANCNLQGSNFQILNPCSTWTKLLSLDYQGLINSFFTNCGQSGGQTNPLNQPLNASLFTSATTYSFTQCVENVAGATNSQIATSNILCQAVSPVIASTQSTITVSTAVPIYFAFSIQPSVWLPGCPQSTWNGVIGNVSAGSTPTATTACLLGFVTSGSNVIGSVYLTGTCLTYGNYNGSPNAPGNLITRVTCNPLNGVVATTFSNGGTQIASTITASQGLVSFMLTLLGGAIFIFLGLGLGASLGGSILGSGTTASLSTNPQGSKMAQAFGLGLLIWAPLYSEFSTWFSSGYLPVFNTNGGLQTGIDGNILNGQIGIVSIILTIMMFLGLYFISQSGTSGTSS